MAKEKTTTVPRLVGWSLRVKLFISLVVVIIFTSFMSTIPTLYTQVQTQRKDLEEYYRGQVEAGRYLLAHVLEKKDTTTARLFLEGLLDQFEVQQVRIIDKYQQFKYALYNPKIKPEPFDSILEDRFIFKDNVMHATLAVQIEKVSYGFIQIQATIFRLNNSIYNTILFNAIVIILILILSIGVASVIQGYITLPIVRLSHHAREIIRKGDFQAHIQKTTADEVGDLYDSINALTRRVHVQKQEITEANIKLKKINDDLSERNSELRAILNQLKEQEALIRQKNAELNHANEELHATLDQVNEQKEIIEKQHHAITESVNYALGIQQAMLPIESLLSQLPEHFIYFRPRDVVSGDFYWVSEEHPLGENGNTGIVITVSDCTGHGIPGAFMSVLGCSLLHQVVNVENIFDPGEIFMRLDKAIQINLRQTLQGRKRYDGMDSTLILLERDKTTRQFVRCLVSGANNPLYHVRNGKLDELPVNKYPVGGGQHKDKIFKTHELSILPGDTLYLFTDGFPDQFGGNKGRKFGYPALKKLILGMQPLPLKLQCTQLWNTMDSWVIGAGKRGQMDDQCIMGIRI